MFMLGYPLFGLMDYFGTGDSYETVLRIRLLFGFPLLVFAFISTFYRSFNAYNKIISGIALFVMNISIPLMYSFLPSDSPDAATYYGGFLITLASMGVSLGDKRFITVSLIVNSVAFCMVAFWVHDLHITDVNLFAKTVFYLATAVLFFCITAHVLENRSVKLFLALQELENEKGKVDLQNDRLRAVNSVKDRFFAIISHDLRTPFNSMLGYFEVKLLEAEEKKIEIDSNILQLFYQETRNTYDFLDNLLQWSKTQMNSTEISKSPELLIDIYEKSIDLFKTQAAQKSITLESNIGKDLLVSCNKELIIAVLRNLISNAIKYSHKGGVVTLDAVLLNDKVVVKVCDSGVGIELKQIKDLQYSIYGRTQKGTNGEIGSGTGLLICHDFLKQHNTALGITSEINKGSEFSFILPRG